MNEGPVPIKCHIEQLRFVCLFQSGALASTKLQEKPLLQNLKHPNANKIHYQFTGEAKGKKLQ